MTSSDDGDLGRGWPGGRPPLDRPLDGRTTTVWGPPPKPEDPPFASPQPGLAPPGRRIGPPGVAPSTIERSGYVAAGFGVAGLFLLIFPPLGIVLGVLAIRGGIRARRRASEANAHAPGARFGIATGTAAIIMSSLIVVVAIVFFSELTDYQDCMSGANTNRAESACQDELIDRIERRLGID